MNKFNILNENFYESKLAYSSKWIKLYQKIPYDTYVYTCMCMYEDCRELHKSPRAVKWCSKHTFDYNTFKSIIMA